MVLINFSFFLINDCNLINSLILVLFLPFWILTKNYLSSFLHQQPGTTLIVSLSHNIFPVGIVAGILTRIAICYSLRNVYKSLRPWHIRRNVVVWHGQERCRITDKKMNKNQDGCSKLILTSEQYNLFLPDYVDYNSVRTLMQTNSFVMFWQF